MRANSIRPGKSRARWAKGTAEAEELIALENWRDGSGICWEEQFAEDNGSSYSPAEWFVFHVQPNDDGNRAAAGDFWEERGIDGIVAADGRIRARVRHRGFIRLG